MHLESGVGNIDGNLLAIYAKLNVFNEFLGVEDISFCSKVTLPAPSEPCFGV
jgi:hypothetical protein